MGQENNPFHFDEDQEVDQHCEIFIDFSLCIFAFVADPKTNQVLVNLSVVYFLVSDLHSIEQEWGDT